MMRLGGKLENHESNESDEFLCLRNQGTKEKLYVDDEVDYI